MKLKIEYSGPFNSVTLPDSDSARTIRQATMTLSTGRVIPTRWVGEQHVREDLGFIPSFADWATAIRPKRWMGRATKLIQAEHEMDHKKTDASGAAE